MRHSRIIRMSLLMFFVGIGVWGVLIMPILFSQETSPFNPPSTAPVQFVGGGSAAGVAPPADGLPPGAGFAGPMGGAPNGLPQPPSGGADASSAGGLPGFYFGTAGGPGGPTAADRVFAPSAPMGMMSGVGMPPGMSGMGSSLTPGQIEEVNLAQHAKNLLSRYGKELKAEEKEKIKSELRAVLHRQFRLQHERRDAELVRIERRLADLRSRLKKRSDAQSTIVDRRLEQLVNDVDGLGWNVQEVPDNLFNDTYGTGGMMGMPGMGGGAPWGVGTSSGGQLGGAPGSADGAEGGAGVAPPERLNPPAIPSSEPPAPGTSGASGVPSAEPAAANPILPPPAGLPVPPGATPEGASVPGGAPPAVDPTATDPAAAVPAPAAPIVPPDVTKP